MRVNLCAATVAIGIAATYRRGMKRRLGILIVPVVVLALATWWPRESPDLRTCAQIEAADFPAITELARSSLQDEQVTLVPNGLCRDEGMPSAAVLAVLSDVDKTQDATEILQEAGWEPADSGGGLVKAGTDVRAYVSLYNEVNEPAEVRVDFRVPLG